MVGCIGRRKGMGKRIGMGRSGRVRKGRSGRKEIIASTDGK